MQLKKLTMTIEVGYEDRLATVATVPWWDLLRHVRKKNKTVLCV